MRTSGFPEPKRCPEREEFWTAFARGGLAVFGGFLGAGALAGLVFLTYLGVKWLAG